MASKQMIVDFIVAQIKDAGEVTAKKMFGEYGIFCNGKMVALVCDDQLYVKPTIGGLELARSCNEGCPYPGAKPCFLISNAQLHDQQWLTELVKRTANELPLPRKKTIRPKIKKG